MSDAGELLDPTAGPDEPDPDLDASLADSDPDDPPEELIYGPEDKPTK